MKLLFVFLSGLILFAYGPKNQDQEVNEIEITQIKELLSNPPEFDGKEVAIQGIISHICRKSGDKMRVAEIDGEGLSILVRLNDHSISFSPEMEGSEILVTGMLVAWIRNLDALEEEHKLGGSEENRHACESTNQAIKLMREKGIDPDITSYIDLVKFEVR